MKASTTQRHLTRNSIFLLIPSTGPIFFCLLFFVLLPVSCFFIISVGHAFSSTSSATVLVINSYHPGYRWSDQMMSGMRETILESAPKTIFFYEYLDSKRFQSSQLDEQLARLIEEKYKQTPIDVILTGDDNALTFFLRHRHGLFSGIPAVFCGVNDLEPVKIEGMAPITGVNEVSDVRETISIALALVPETKRIVVVNDATVTGRNVNREIQRVAKTYADRVTFSFLENLHREDLLNELSALKTGDLVLYTFFFRDSKNRFYEYDDSARKVCEASPVPVFGLWEFNLGYGIVGGKLVSGYEQGKTAGTMALQILKGVKADSIPVIMKSPNRFSFDYKVLERFGLDLTHLPADSLVINRPASFYQVYKPLIWSGFSAIAVLTILIAFLLGTIARRRKVEKYLQQSEQQMSQIIDFLPDPTFVIDRERRVIAWNRAMEVLTGVKAHTIVGLGDHEYSVPFYGTHRPVVIDLVNDWSDEVADTYTHVKKEGDRVFAETLNPVHLLGDRHFKITAGPLCDENGFSVGAIETLHDITERRIAEARLAKRENLLHQFMENTPAAVAMCDTKMNYLGYSRRWLIDYRLPDENLIGRCHYDIFGTIPDDWKRQHERCLKGEVIEREEEPFYRSDGTMDWVQRSLHPWWDRTGKIGGLILFTEVTTHKKEAEENLRLMELVLNNSPAVLLRWEPKKGWPVSFVSKNIRQFGYQPEKLLSGEVNFSSIIHPGDFKWLTRDLNEKIFQRFPAFKQECRIFTQNGQTRWVDCRTMIERGPKGDIRHYQSVILDITDRKKIENELVEANRMLRLILDTIPVRVFWKDIDCRYLGCNQPFAEDAGRSSPEELIGKHDYEFPWGNHQADLYRSGDVAVMASGESLINIEEPQTTPMGATIWLQTSKVPIRDDNERIIGVLGTYQDITERKRSEEELSRLRNYLVNIIDSMPSILVGVDSEKKVTQWNRQAEKNTGLTFEMARSCPLEEVFSRLNPLMGLIDTAIKERRVLRKMKAPHHRQEEIRFEDVTIFPLMIDGVEGAVIRVDDVTERVRLEEMMIQSEKMLSVGGLAAGMAHEINNPLAGIIQNAAVLENRLLKDFSANEKAAAKAGTTMDAIRQYMEQRQLKKMINNICASGERAATIVRNMLSFARKSDNIVSSYDLRVIMDETIELAQTDYDMKKHYDFKQVSIIRDYAEEMVLIPCEKSKIQQVFLNILKNGAEAMRENTIGRKNPLMTLTIKEAGPWGQVEIADNGPGMHEDIRRRILEPFFTTKAEGQGTGLGLSVSYFIVTENHSGEMDVFSQKGKGTRFVIRLPKSQKV